MAWTLVPRVPRGSWCPVRPLAVGAARNSWPRRAACALHVARGWLERPCPTCKALAGEPCSTPTGLEASRVHTARLRPARRELVWRPAVWEELTRRDGRARALLGPGRLRWPDGHDQAAAARGWGAARRRAVDPPGRALPCARGAG